MILKRHSSDITQSKILSFGFNIRKNQILGHSSNTCWKSHHPVASFATQNSLFFFSKYFQFFFMFTISLFLVSIKNHYQKPCGASLIKRGPGDVTWDKGLPTFGAPNSHAPNKLIEWIFGNIDTWSRRSLSLLCVIKNWMNFGIKT